VGTGRERGRGKLSEKMVMVEAYNEETERVEGVEEEVAALMNDWLLYRLCRGAETSLCLFWGLSPLPDRLNNGLCSSYLQSLHIAQNPQLKWSKIR
jgi:hypothetical protein